MFVFTHVSGDGKRTAFAYDFYKTGAAAPRLKVNSVPQQSGSFLNLASGTTMPCNVTARVNKEHMSRTTCPADQIENLALKGEAFVVDGVSSNCSPIHVEVSSGGLNDGNLASILVNGVPMLNCTQGINLVVLNQGSAELKLAESFDTYSMPPEAAKLAGVLNDQVPTLSCTLSRTHCLCSAHTVCALRTDKSICAGFEWRHCDLGCPRRWVPDA